MLAPPLEPLRTRLLSGEAVVAGVLSGTSADGIDVALVRFGSREPSEPVAEQLGAPVTLAFETRPFPDALAGRVRRALDGDVVDLRGTALLTRDLGRAFGRAARDVARERALTLELVGSHGQTVWHHDGVEESGAATLQLGDGDFVAEEAECAVVSDFRQRDVAAGGEGAPLSALVDGELFAGLPRPSAVLNLGGIANVTVLTADEQGPAFDTGPAGSLLDGLARRLLDRPFDDGGAAAFEGAVDARLLEELLRHPFLERAPPKSTGRDTFGEPWVDHVVERAGALGVAAPQDLLATAAEFVARHVAGALEHHAPADLQWIAVCGGGVRNARVLDGLARAAPQPVASTADFGVDPDAREALVFAVLAARCVLGLPSTLPAATGARGGRVLGKLSLPLTGAAGGGDSR